MRVFGQTDAYSILCIDFMHIVLRSLPFLHVFGIRVLVHHSLKAEILSIIERLEIQGWGWQV